MMINLCCVFPTLNMVDGSFLSVHACQNRRMHMRRSLGLHQIFAVGMWIKGLDGVLEVIGGIMLLLISPAALNRLVIALTQHELVEDPHDRVATTLRQAAAL